MTREERLALEPLANVWEAYRRGELAHPYNRFIGRGCNERNLAEALELSLVEGPRGPLLTLADCRAAHDLIQPRKPF